MSGVGYVYNPSCEEHYSLGHPERPERLKAIVSHLEQQGILDQLIEVSSQDATVEDIELIHDPALIDEIQSVSDRSGWLDGDTYTQVLSYRIALRAVGSCLSALEAITAGNIESAFCLVRPPGHHATPNKAMGFCLFNNLAVAAAYALNRLGMERVAIIDFDVHHGNGTQDAFYDDPRVLYVSTHQYPFYPGSGHYSENGKNEGSGSTVNIPLPPGTRSDQFVGVYKEICAPLIHRYQPQLILVSAGFDAHTDDPLAQLEVNSQGYYEVALLLKELADQLCSGRILFALEGGYDLAAISWSVGSCLDALRGKPYVADPLTEVEIPLAPIDEVMTAVKETHRL